MAACIGLRADNSFVGVETREAQKAEACGEMLGVLHGPEQFQCKREVQAATDKARSYRHGVLHKQIPDMLQQHTRKSGRIQQHLQQQRQASPLVPRDGSWVCKRLFASPERGPAAASQFLSERSGAALRLAANQRLLQLQQQLEGMADPLQGKG